MPSVSLIVVGKNAPFPRETTQLLQQSVRALSPWTPSALFGGGMRLKHDEPALQRAIWGAVWAMGRAMRTMSLPTAALMCDAAINGLRRCPPTLNTVEIAETACGDSRCNNVYYDVERRFMKQRLAFALTRMVMIGGTGSAAFFQGALVAEMRNIATDLNETSAVAAVHASTRAHREPEALLRVASYIAEIVPDEKGAADMLLVRLP